MREVVSLDVGGYGGQPVPNRLIRDSDGAQRLGVLLPGLGYTCQMPLLFYPAQILRALGADLLRVEQDYSASEFQALPQSEQQNRIQTDVLAVMATALALRHYERVSLVGKSLGTFAMGYILQAGLLPAARDLVWLTPLLRHDWLKEAICSAGDGSLFVIGTADGQYDPDILDMVMSATTGRALVVKDADHALQVPGDLSRSLDDLKRIVLSIEEHLGGA